MKKNKYYPLIILSAIFLIGLFLRLYRINLNSPALYADETGQYFVFKSILEGTSSFIEHLIKLSFSFTWFLGLKPLGVRLPAAIYGSLLIPLVYFLGLSFSGGKKNESLVFAGMTAIIPWDFMISRIGHSHIPIMIFMVCLHVLLYHRAKTIKTYILSFLPLGVAMVYYPSVIFIVPFIVIHFLLEINKLFDRKFRLPFFAGLVSLTLVFGAFLSFRFHLFSAGGRGLDLVIWNDVNTPWQTDKYRALSWNSEPTVFSFGLPPEKLANKLVYNRAMANLSTFAHNYFTFFSPDWLFFKGDAILRHSTGQVGAFYPFLIPFMLYGAFVFFKVADKKTKQIFLIWILASPIPAAITKDGAGYLLRVVTVLPFLTYFCALGIVESFNLIKKNLRIPYGIIVGLIGLYSAYYFFFGYFHVYPSLSARSYEYGFKELSDFQVANNNAPMLVIWDGYYHNNDFRFWQATPFSEYSSFKIKETVIGESHFNQTFTNLYFVNPKSLNDLQRFLSVFPIKYIVLPDRYFINYPTEIDAEFATPSAVIKYPDQTPALRVYNLEPK